ncbi:MAG: hypothetical protein VKJ24_01970 [Synechococcales bacterium]|nr:hypothetical protein [Synechococcales bacterium]
MLIDPDNSFEEWTDNVRAKNLPEARQRSEQMAGDRNLTEVINVTQLGKKPNKAGNYNFVCWFRTELSNDSNNDPSN